MWEGDPSMVPEIVGSLQRPFKEGIPNFRKLPDQGVGFQVRAYRSSCHRLLTSDTVGDVPRDSRTRDTLNHKGDP